MAEKQRLIKHELEAVRATGGDTYVPGFPNMKLYQGEAISKYFNVFLPYPKFLR